MVEEALKAADRCLDVAASRASSSSIKSLVQHWLEDKNGFRAQYGASMQQQCDRLLQGYSQRQVRPLVICQMGLSPKNENLKPEPQAPCDDAFSSFCLWPFIWCIQMFLWRVLKRI